MIPNTGLPWLLVQAKFEQRHLSKGNLMHAVGPCSEQAPQERKKSALDKATFKAHAVLSPSTMETSE